MLIETISVYSLKAVWKLDRFRNYLLFDAFRSYCPFTWIIYMLHALTIVEFCVTGLVATVTVGKLDPLLV